MKQPFIPMFIGVHHGGPYWTISPFDYNKDFALMNNHRLIAKFKIKREKNMFDWVKDVRAFSKEEIKAIARDYQK